FWVICKTCINLVIINQFSRQLSFSFLNMNVFSFFNGANHLLFLFLLPIAFEIGGKPTGLALSFALFSYYSLIGLTKVLWWRYQGLGWIIVSELLNIPI